MAHAKNYENMSKFVKVVPKNTVASFFPDTVYNVKRHHSINERLKTLRLY